MRNENIVATSHCGDLRIGQSNDLMDLPHKLSPDAQSILMFALKDVAYGEPWNGDITIYPYDLADYYEIPRRRAIQFLRNSVEQLGKNPLSFPYHGEDERRTIDVFWLKRKDSPVSRDSSAPIVLTFNDDLIPFLSNLKEHYTSFSEKHLKALRHSNFAFRLYQWLCREKNLNRNKNGNEYSLILDIERMCQLTLTTSTDWYDFYRYTLSPALKMINDGTDIHVDHYQVKTGRKTTAVKFVYRFGHHALAESEIETVRNDHSLIEPKKPRLNRKPVHEDKIIDWATSNYKILMMYEVELISFHQKIGTPKSSVLPLPMLRRMIEFMDICETDKKRIESRKSELALRQGVRTSKKQLEYERRLAGLSSKFGQPSFDLPLMSYVLNIAWASERICVVMTSADNFEESFSMKNDLQIMGWIVIEADKKQLKDLPDPLISYIERAFRLRNGSHPESLMDVDIVAKNSLAIR